MLAKVSKVVFDKTAFEKFMIICNFKQNIDETHSKQPKIQRKIHTNLWIFKISRKKSMNQKSRDFCQIFVISEKKTIPQGMDSKSIESYRLTYKFFFFVISISVLEKLFNQTRLRQEPTQMVLTLRNNLGIQGAPARHIIATDSLTRLPSR